MDSQTYDPKTTALVLVDVLNDFLAEDGKLAPAIKPMVDQLHLIEHLLQLLNGARDAGVHVIYSPHGLDEHSFDDVTYLHPTFAGALENKVFWKGSYGDDFYPPLAPRAGETVVSHHRMFDSFINTDLHTRLTALGVQKLVLAGLTSQTCVEGTGRHALDAGYHVTFLSDAVADFTEAAHRAAVEISYPTFGHQTLTVEQFLTAIAPSATATAP
jgi:ureidoacrylate peracid hydrolase